MWMPNSVRRRGRLLGGAMRARADLAGHPQHGEFVIGLDETVEMQIVENAARIVGTNPSTAEFLASPRSRNGNHRRHSAKGISGLANDDDVEVLDPVSCRRSGTTCQ